MKHKRYLIVLTLALSLVFAQPVCVLATNAAQTEEVDKRPEKAPQDDNKQAQEIIENWNKLTSEQKQEVYSIMEKQQKVKMEMVDKLLQLKVLDENTAKVIKIGMDKAYKKLMEDKKCPMICPRHNR